jgi:hypothetical protein
MDTAVGVLPVVFAFLVMSIFVWSHELTDSRTHSHTHAHQHTHPKLN